MKEWWEWALGACGIIILFLLGLGISDIRRRLNKIDRLDREIVAIKTKLGMEVENCE